jgi:GR25 family glycosyltransferase involved in LPS biosynthesis
MLDVHIINMNRSKNKWVRCSQRFRDQGFRVFRQEGYDVRDWDLSRYQVGLQKIGELGCNLSHRALWEKQLLNDPSKNYLVVAEDDAVPLVSSERFMEQIRQLPLQDVDFVHFGCGSRCKIHPFTGAHCYLVTRAGAQKYFAHWKNRIDVAVDMAIGETPGVRLVHVKPEIATFERLRAWESDIINTNNPLAKLLDYIPYGENTTLGWVMFYPGNGRPRKIDGLFLFLSFVLLVSLLLIKKLQ